MSLPHSQLAALHRGLAEHERRVAQLREGIRLAKEEVEFHKLLLDFAQNERTIAALHELHDRAALMEELVDDPMGYCRERGIPIPEGVTLFPTRDAVSVHLRCGAWEMKIGWNCKTGLFAEPPQGPSACLDPRFMSSVDPGSGLDE